VKLWRFATFSHCVRYPKKTNHALWLTRWISALDGHCRSATNCCNGAFEPPVDVPTLQNSSAVLLTPESIAKYDIIGYCCADSSCPGGAEALASWKCILSDYSY
jgi:hypothetical protein